MINSPNANKSAMMIQKAYKNYTARKRLNCSLRKIHEQVLNQKIDINNRFFGHGQLVGETTIRDKFNNPVNALVSLVNKKGFKENYYIYADKDKSDFKKYAGFINIVSSFKNSFIKPYCDNSRSVFIELMKAPQNDKYSGIGTRLHQIAVERSMNNGLEGRVFLNAAWNSHGFHYKNGYRASDLYKPQMRENLNKNIEKELINSKIENRKPNTEFLGKIIMVLSKENFEKMKGKFLKLPILKGKASKL